MATIRYTFADGHSEEVEVTEEFKREYEFSARAGTGSVLKEMKQKERFGYDTARKFVYYFRGVIAQHYIDWDATEAENPLAEETEDSYTEEESETGGEDAA